MSGSRDNRAWPRDGASAARRGGRPAGSAPAGSPLFSRLDRVLSSSVPLPQQEAVGQQDQGRVVVEPPPGSPLEMVQPQLLLHLLVAVLHRPATLPQPNRLLQARALRQVAEGVFDLAVRLLF